MVEKKEKRDKETGALILDKDDILVQEQKFSGIMYDQIFPVSCIYKTESVDGYSGKNNFNTDYASDKNKKREIMLSEMDRYIETQYQYTE